jgi:hypothetical protein
MPYLDVVSWVVSILAATGLLLLILILLAGVISLATFIFICVAGCVAITILIALIIAALFGAFDARPPGALQPPTALAPQA